MAGSKAWFSGTGGGDSFWDQPESGEIETENNVTIKGDAFEYFQLHPVLSTMNARLTLTSNTPITTSDVTGATTLYYTPHNGEIVTLHNGTDTWLAHTLTEISITNSGLSANKNYDVFVYNDSGTLKLAFGTAWTDDITRAEALGSQDGIAVKNGDTDYRHVGTIRTDSTGKFEDSETSRFVWNRYNKVERVLKKTESTTSWTVTAPGSWVWSQVNSDSNNKVSAIVGDVGQKINITHYLSHSVNGGGTVNAGIGVDVTNASSGIFPTSNSTVSVIVAAQCQLDDYIPLGYHDYNMLQLPNISNNTTFYGESTNNTFIGGMTGKIEG